jgi:peptidyl-prolyl cis-trans isomerase A (cyclophilin A)
MNMKLLPTARSLSFASLPVAFLAMSLIATPALAQMGDNKPAEKPAEKKATDEKDAASKPAETKPAEATQQADVMKYVSFETSMGTMLFELNETKAPISTANFLAYVKDGHYAGTIFHRVLAGFVVQGGGMDVNKREKETKAPIKNEWRNGLKNDRGTLAMARTAVSDSATSQFYINLKNNDALNQPRDGAGYAVFGKVVHGMDVVDKIAAVQVDRAGMPAKDVTVTAAKELTKEEADKMMGKETKKEEGKEEEKKEGEKKAEEKKPG